jgi:hypothetical protein
MNSDLRRILMVSFPLIVINSIVGEWVIVLILSALLFLSVLATDSTEEL